MKISKLKLKKNNPRKISSAALEKLAESIERDPEFMVLRPMVVDKDGTVIGGNQRLKAIKKLEMKDVPDSWVMRADDLTDEQKRRFVLVDNAPDGMAGEWDISVLSDYWSESDLADLGFDTESMGLKCDFEPGGEGDQGKLDQLDPKMATCPGCGGEFDTRKQG